MPGTQHTTDGVDDLDAVPAEAIHLLSGPPRTDVSGDQSPGYASHSAGHGAGRTADPPAPLTSPSRTGPPAPRAGWAHSPWALPVLVALLVALVGFAAVRQARATTATDLVHARQMAAVQLGVATLTDTASSPTYDTQGRLLTRAQVQVFNRGDQAVRISAVSLSSAHTTLTDQAAVLVAATAGASVDLGLAVDCANLASDQGEPTSAEPGATGTWLQLQVAPEGRGATFQDTANYPVLDQPGVSLSEQLATICDPAASGAVSADTVLTDDGRMRVQVTNTSDVPAALELRASAGLGATTQVPLPTEVGANAQVSVVVALAPDCARIPEPGQGVTDLRADIVSPRRGHSEVQVLTYEQSSVWVAREVALACG